MVLLLPLYIGWLVGGVYLWTNGFGEIQAQTTELLLAKIGWLIVTAAFTIFMVIRAVKAAKKDLKSVHEYDKPEENRGEKA